MTLLVAQPEGIPLPAPSAISQPYWDALRNDQLIYQRCDACGIAQDEASIICRFCGSRALSWHQSSGLGTVYSWTCVWRPQTPDFVVPYLPIIVDIAEGYRLLSNMIGCEHDEVTVGTPVGVEFHEIGGGYKLPYFSPRGGE